MPRPKANNKTKTKPIKIKLKSLSRSSTLPSLHSSQISVPLSNANHSYNFVNNNINWLKTSIHNSTINKIGRRKKTEVYNEIADSIVASDVPTSFSSDVNGGRVVINPAVLRYLEQNRSISYSSVITKCNYETNEYFDKARMININELKDENTFNEFCKNFNVHELMMKTDSFSSSTIFSPLSTLSNEQCIPIHEFIEIDKVIEDELFRDFCTCSTDFLTSARLAQWILAHKKSSKFETKQLTT